MKGIHGSQGIFLEKEDGLKSRRYRDIALRPRSRRRPSPARVFPVLQNGLGQGNTPQWKLRRCLYSRRLVLHMNRADIGNGFTMFKDPDNLAIFNHIQELGCMFAELGKVGCIHGFRL